MLRLRQRGKAYLASAGVVALAGIALVAVAMPEPASARTTATFTWSIAPRFGPDRNRDGLPDDPHNTFAAANSNQYSVTLNACQLANLSGGPPFRWQFDGGAIEDAGLSCVYRRSLTRGPHTVRLLLGSGQDVTRAINVRDLLVVSLGDSYASGEGAPDFPAGPAARWQNRRCHRSSAAAPARAARAIENADAHSVVTFVHVACSGASIAAGVLGPYAGLLPGAVTMPLPSQIADVLSIVGSRRIDGILVGVGANDVGFGSLVEMCAVQAACHLPQLDAAPDPALVAVRAALQSLCSLLPVASAECGAYAQTLSFATGPSAASQFDEILPVLAERYADLASAIARPRGSGGLGTPLGRVLLTPYFDPTRGSDGSPCDPLAYPLSPERVFPGVSAPEYAWAAGVVERLNAAMAAADAGRTWTRILGIPQVFAAHGYCAGAPWVNRLPDTFATQGDVYGVLHPTRLGHAEVAKLITPSLAALLQVP